MKKVNLFALGLISLSMVSCGGETKEEEEEVEKIVTETYNLDTEISSITWTGEYFKGEKFDHNHQGTVMFKSGSIEFGNEVIQSGSFEIDLSTIDEIGAPMGEKSKEELIGHLKSEDYFNIEKFPTAKVTLTQCTKEEIMGTFTVNGIESEFKAPINMAVNEGTIKVSGDFTLDFAPFNMAGIGSSKDPEYVSSNVKFSIGLKFSK